MLLLFKIYKLIIAYDMWKCTYLTKIGKKNNEFNQFKVASSHSEMGTFHILKYDGRLQYFQALQSKTQFIHFCPLNIGIRKRFNIYSSIIIRCHTEFTFVTQLDIDCYLNVLEHDCLIPCILYYQTRYEVWLL